jgi:putative Mn2+ efflux pump MntP
MDVFTYLLVGTGLAMDCVAVSLVGGLAARKHQAPLVQTAFSFALTFGFFQGAMAVVGYYAGGTFEARLQAVDHWVAFGLLALIGGKMLYEAFTEKEEGEDEAPAGLKALIVAGFATSIDALAVGVSYALLLDTIFLPSLIIGLVTAVLCIPAVLLGAKLGEKFSTRAEVAGGLILIAIGVRILFEHLG